MSGIVSRLECFMRERIGATWPDCAGVSVEVRPLLDLSLGDFGLDCCLDLGAALKRKPEEVAVEFVAALPAHPEFAFVAMDGFINVSLRQPENLRAEDRITPRLGTEPHRVVVQPPTAQVSSDGFVRLLGSAVIQTVLLRVLGGAGELFVGSARCEGDSVGDLFRAGLCHGIESDRGAARRAIESHLIDGAAAGATVWVGPNFLERGEFRDFYRRYFVGRSRFSVRCPARAWIEGFQESWWDIANRGHHLAAVALSVSSNRAPGELDEHALALAEQGNLRWFLESTLRRLERLSAGPLGSGGASRPLSPVVRRVALRVATSEWFARGAALRGEIPEWIDAVTDLLRSLNLWLNTPQTRLEFEMGGLSPVEREILSGATKAVSDIIQSNPLFYEVDRA